MSVREKMSGPGRGGRRFEKCARDKQQSKQGRKKKQKKSRTEAGNCSGAPGSARRRIVGAALCVGLSQVCKDNIFEFFEFVQGKEKKTPKARIYRPPCVAKCADALLNMMLNLTAKDRLCLLNLLLKVDF